MVACVAVHGMQSAGLRLNPILATFVFDGLRAQEECIPKSITVKPSQAIELYQQI